MLEEVQGGGVVEEHRPTTPHTAGMMDDFLPSIIQIFSIYFIYYVQAIDYVDGVDREEIYDASADGGRFEINRGEANLS